MKNMRLALLIFSILTLSLKLSAKPPTIQIDQFEKGHFWVWSYSEWNEEEKNFFDPYLFETYEVTDVEDAKITIEMSSSPSIDQKQPPHHRFVINLDRCLTLGQSQKSLKNLRIHFYTKSMGNDWKLLSKNHKALAFTEKFNCLSASQAANIDLHKFQNSQWPSFQWPEFSPTSWYIYSKEAPFRGVMIKRNAGNILVRLEEVSY